MAQSSIQAVSYLAPNWLSFYQFLTNHVSETLGLKSSLLQGNDPLEDPLLLQDQVDLAFICGLPLARYCQVQPDRLQAIAAPAMDRSRYQNRPIYFADVIVQSNSPYRKLTDLRGKTFCFNDRGSNSGYNLLRHHLMTAGYANHFFSHAIPSGSHQQSIRWVIEGKSDCAAIDSTVLEKESQNFPELNRHLQVITSIAAPMPPIVVAQHLGVERIQTIQRALLQPSKSLRSTLQAAGVQRYLPVTLADYAILNQKYEAVTQANYDLF